VGKHVITLIGSGRIIAAFLAVPLILAFMLTPASAATKVLDVRFQNIVEEIPFPLLVTICGVTDTFSAEFFTNNVQIVIWDNGRFQFQSTNSISVWDSSGVLIARDRFAGHEVQGTGGLPLTVVLNILARCTTQSVTPGVLCSFQFGFTFSEDGTLREEHGTPIPFSCFTEE